jgi:hypothetical protein
MGTPWPTWCAPTPPSCARWPGTGSRAEAVTVLARAPKTLIWEATRHLPRLRHALGEFFSAALDAFADLAAADALELLATAPDPQRAARLSRTQIARPSPGPAAGTGPSRPPRSRPPCAAPT